MARFFPRPFSHRDVTASAAKSARQTVIISAPTQARLQGRDARSERSPQRALQGAEPSPPRHAPATEWVPTPFTQAGEIPAPQQSEAAQAPAVAVPSGPAVKKKLFEDAEYDDAKDAGNVLPAAQKWISALTAPATPVHNALNQQWNALSAMVQSMVEAKDQHAMTDRELRSQLERRISVMKRELRAKPRPTPHTAEEQRCIKRLQAALTHFEKITKQSIGPNKPLARESLLAAQQSVTSALEKWQLIQGKRNLIAQASVPFLLWEMCDSAAVNTSVDEFFDSVCKQTDDATMATMLSASQNYAEPWLASKLQQASDRSKVLAAAENWIAALTSSPTFGENALNNQWNALRTTLQSMYKEKYVRNKSDSKVLAQITTCIQAVKQDINTAAKGRPDSPDEKLRVTRLRAALTRFEELSKQLIGSNNQLPQERVLEAYEAVGNALRNLLQIRQKPELIARASAPFLIWQTDLCDSADVNTALDKFFDKVCSTATDVTMASMLRASQKYAGSWLTKKLQQADERLRVAQGKPRKAAYLHQLAKYEANEISLLDELRKVVTNHYSMMNDAKGIDHKGISKAEAQILDEHFASVSRISGAFVSQTLLATGLNLFNVVGPNKTLEVNRAVSINKDHREKIAVEFTEHIIDITPHALQVTSMQDRFTTLGAKFFYRLTGRYQLTSAMQERLTLVAQRQVHYRNLTLELAKNYADALYRFEEDYPDWANDADLRRHYALLEERRDLYVRAKDQISAATENYNGNVKKAQQRMTTQFAASPIAPLVQ